MNVYNEEIACFIQKIKRFNELVDSMHIGSYMLENPKGRSEEILKETIEELKNEELLEKKLMKDICYSLYDFTTNKNYEIAFNEGKIIDNNNISIQQFCKNNYINQKDFINYLKEKKYIYIQYYGQKKERHKNVAFPKYDTEEGNGLFEMNRKPNYYNENKNNINIQLTKKGQEYFIDLLRKEGLY